MKKSILLFFLLLLGLNSLGLSAFYSLMMYRQVSRMLRADREELVVQVEKRLDLLGSLVPLVERDARREAEERLKEAADYLLGLEKAPGDWTVQDLRKAGAGDSGVELYWIGEDLTVEVTTFEPDQGLDLGSISENFERFLREDVRGAGGGKVVSQHMSHSNRTGVLQMYAYYHPPGTDGILEISLSMGGEDPSWGSGETAFEPRRLFSSLLEENRYLQEVDLFSLSRISSWSLITGEQVDLPGDLKQALLRGEKREIDRGDSVTYYERIDHFSSPESFSDQFCLKVACNYGAYREEARRIGVLGGVISAVFLLVFSLVTVFWVDRYLVRPVLRIHQALLQAAGGDYSRRLTMKRGFREYREITSAYNELTAAAEKRRYTLEDQKAQLLTAVRQRDVLMREVHHRVKNNLQIITSLISLEDEKMGAEGKQILQEISGRVSAMSAVHEILYGAENVAFLSLDDLVRRVMDAVSDVYYDYRVVLKLEVSIPAGGVSLDAAIPLALILSEALINAITHGVKPGEELPFRVDSSLQEGRWLLSMEDRGRGFPPGEEKSAGFGFILMNSLADQLGGSFRTYNRQGAVVELSLPEELLEDLPGFPPADPPVSTTSTT